MKPPDLQEFFKSCGTINRITILVDHRTGQSKGYAYMEFLEAEAVEIALGMFFLLDCLDHFADDFFLSQA